MDELMKSYPDSLKEAFNISELNSVEAYVDAEMLSLIVPLAIAFLAVRIARPRDRGRRGARLPRHAARHARGAPHARCRRVPRLRRRGRRGAGRHHCADVGRRLARGRRAVADRARARLRERVAAGHAVRWTRAARRRRAAPRRHRHGGRGGHAGRDVRHRPRRQARRADRAAARHLGLQVLRLGGRATASTRSPSPASRSRARCSRPPARSSSTGATCAERSLP